MLRLFYCFCLILLGTTVRAQDSTIRYLRPARIILKLAPLWLLDTDPALAGALEIRTGPKTSVQAEFGYGRPGWGDLGGDDRHEGTWRMKTEMRFYRNRYQRNPGREIRVATTYPLGNYWAIEAYTKLLNVDHRWTYIGPVYDAGFGPAPDKERHTLIRRSSLSLIAKVGRQFGWTDNAHQGKARVLWDVYTGLGVRLTDQTNGEDGPMTGYGTSFRGMFNRFNTAGFRIAPTLSAGVKLGFAL